MEKPSVIKGGIAIDDRGKVSFVNDFNFQNIQRFYMIENHSRGFVRAWHAHKKEAKYFCVVRGSMVIGAVKVDDWKNPGPDLSVNRFVLSSLNPSILHIPAGYANGFMNLTDDAKVIIFSSSTLEQSLNDDFRYDARLWDIWQVEER